MEFLEPLDSAYLMARSSDAGRKEASKLQPTVTVHARPITSFNVSLNIPPIVENRCVKDDQVILYVGRVTRLMLLLIHARLTFRDCMRGCAQPAVAIEGFRGLTTAEKKRFVET